MVLVVTGPRRTGTLNNMVNRTNWIRGGARKYCNRVIHEILYLNCVVEPDGICEKKVHANSPPVVRNHAVGNLYGK